MAPYTLLINYLLSIVVLSGTLILSGIVLLAWVGFRVAAYVRICHKLLDLLQLCEDV